MGHVFFDGRSAIDFVGQHGVGRFSGSSQSQLEAKHGRLEVLTLDEAAARIDRAATTNPVEVNKDEWNEGLNVLPPLKWCQDGNAESFRIIEPLTGTVHTTYVRMGKRYFVMNRPLAEAHEQLMGLVARHLIEKPRRRRALNA